ncbi:beta-lactamase/transpeptidase-like protein [Mycena albidolilacea]|uniref:Beta-lactamase/transpeptidase-like protein n=1 Tax=Mycena albidolilacea TaxID=1033008 RepID=A0AAD6ZZ69_9AGAR|nr:beta-lactamase/transpeptidase-like protein [Mycena albidolilacea]
MIFQSIFAPLILTAALGLATQNPLADSENGTVFDEQFSSFIQEVLDANNVTGMSVGVLLPNGEVEFGTWGNRTESGEKVAPDTIFGIGSLSKGFLSASLGILMQDFATGKNATALPHAVTEFNWDTKLRDLLPGEWMTEDEFSTSKANLVELLSHVTGLPSHDGSYSAEDSPRDLVLRMRNLRAAYEFRQLLEYNNPMYIAGSYVVSKLSGMAYRDFVENRIMLPLNMSSSTMHPDRVSESDKFSQTWTSTRRRIPFFMTENTADLIAGAGGVISTAEDMLLWAKLIMNGGVDPQTNIQIIPNATVNLATTGHSIFSNEGNELFSVMEYGLGWVRTTYRGHELIWHNGGAQGVSSFCALFPHDGFAVVVLANTDGTITQNVTLTVADRIIGPGPNSPPPSNVVSSTPIGASPVSSARVLSGLEGTYSNLGYGNFTLCSSAQPITTQCAGVVQDFERVDAASRKPSNSAELYSAWPRFWGSHLRLTPISGNAYDGKLTTLYVDGYGVDHTPFEDPVIDLGVAFMEEEGRVTGLGFFVASGETWREKKGGSVRDIADAWFDKF